MEKRVILLTVVVLAWTPLGQSAEEAQAPEFCKLFPHDGPSMCLAYIPQFFYNSTSQECELFIYGGCDGNKNRFDSKQVCMATCHPQTGRPSQVKKLYGLEEADDFLNSHQVACHEPPESGPCEAYDPKFFFSSTSHKCEIFIYGGCGGNMNKFKSLRDCQMECGTVPQFNTTEVCKMAPETGPCKAAFPRLYYNHQSRRCEPFIYGGCGGNDNRFESTEDCMRICHPKGSDVILPLIIKPEEAVDCSLPPEVGRCRANVPSYFYNSTSRTCETFTYGGCGGNSNRFVFERECYLSCPPSVQQPTETPGTRPTDDPCHLEADAGACFGSIPRYFYNHNAKKCQEFVYTGCLGNRNNFVDEAHCMRVCEKN